MSEIVEIEKKEPIDLLDLCYFLLMTVTAYYTRNTFCQIMMIVFIGVAALKMFSRTLTRKKTIYFVGMTLFILYGFLGIELGIAVSNKVARTMAVSLTLNLIMVYVICQYILWKENIGTVIKFFENSIFVAAIITIVASGGKLFTQRLGTDTEINANMLAMLSVYAMVICMYLMKESNYRWMYVLKIVAYVGIVLLSGSRKGLLMIASALLVISVVNGRKKLIRNLFFTVVALLVIYYMVMNVPVFYNIIGVRVEDLMSLVFEDTTKDNSLLNRQILIEEGWSYIEKNPWFGYGYDNFKLVSSIVGTYTGDFGLYSHNNYVEMLFGCGAIGTTLYYIPMVAILIGLIKNVRTHPCVVYLLAIFVAKHVVEYGYVSYYERIDAYVVAFVLGCLLWCKNKKDEEEKEKENAVNKETSGEPV